MNDTLCNELANILKGEGKFKNNVCTVTSDRKNLNVKLLGNQLHTGNMFSFAPSTESGKSLITGEIVLLENEVPYIVSSLYNQGITVSAIHNHWLGDQPHLIYVHFEALMEPRTFANKVAYILSYIE